MSLEEALAENTAATNRNSDLLERVIAGQEAAMEKLASGGTSTRKPRTPKPDSTSAPETSGEAGNASEGSAATESPEAAATPAAEPEAPTVASIVAAIGTDADKLKEHVTGWTGSTDDADERAKRVQLLKDIAAKFGVAPKFADLIPHLQQTVFLIERAKASGVASVDVAAAYDFDGDPAQEAPAAGGSSDFE
jgi:hypothetical protein